LGVYAWYQEFEFEICLYFFLNFKQTWPVTFLKKLKKLKKIPKFFF
jgi:hypothetical protein